MDLYSDCLRGDLARVHHQFLRLTTIVTEHIESIILALGQDIRDWSDGFGATESNAEVTCLGSSQELENPAGEQRVPCCTRLI
jgi:hypothetical protein